MWSIWAGCNSLHLEKYKKVMSSEKNCQFVGKAKRECGGLEIPAAVEVINKIFVLFPTSKRENRKMPCVRKSY